MHPDHIRAMWVEYRRTLTVLSAHRSGRGSPTAIKQVEAEISGMEKLLDCFAARHHINAVREEFQLPAKVD